jgi:hypothetical protein
MLPARKGEGAAAGIRDSDGLAPYLTLVPFQWLTAERFPCLASAG